MTKLSLIAAAALAAPIATTAFAPISQQRFVVSPAAFVTQGPLFAEVEDKASEAAFLPAEPGTVDEDAAFAKVESLGKGSAKAKRGKRKGGETKKATAAKPAAALVEEEIYFEGPPAITETIAPTLSILTVVGIIPAAAAWARQAWVRYKITTRRIRVTSGINGNEMAEIVYPDIVEIRTVKRLFGDGDMVAFLRDGAKFEMRNIPNFEETMEFICAQVDPKVAEQYKQKGDVTEP
jgi:hypothetical protein